MSVLLVCWWTRLSRFRHKLWVIFVLYFSVALSQYLSFLHLLCFLLDSLMRFKSARGRNASIRRLIICLARESWRDWKFESILHCFSFSCFQELYWSRITFWRGRGWRTEKREDCMHDVALSRLRFVACFWSCVCLHVRCVCSFEVHVRLGDAVDVGLGDDGRIVKEWRGICVRAGGGISSQCLSISACSGLHLYWADQVHACVSRHSQVQLSIFSFVCTIFSACCLLSQFASGSQTLFQIVWFRISYSMFYVLKFWNNSASILPYCCLFFARVSAYRMENQYWIGPSKKESMTPRVCWRCVCKHALSAWIVSQNVCLCLCLSVCVCVCMQCDIIMHITLVRILFGISCMHLNFL